MRFFHRKKTLVLSRELIHLAAERGAAAELKRYVEGAFAAQFPTMKLTVVDAVVDTPAIEDFWLKLPDDFELELIE